MTLVNNSNYTIQIQIVLSYYELHTLLVSASIYTDSLSHHGAFHKIDDDIKPEWRDLYKPPLIKRF